MCPYCWQILKINRHTCVARIAAMELLFFFFFFFASSAIFGSLPFDTHSWWQLKPALLSTKLELITERFMYQIHFLYNVSNTLDADCHTWNRNGRSDSPFTYSGVNQQSERWIEKIFWWSIDVWCLAVKRSKWFRNRDYLCFCGLWMIPVPACGKPSWNEWQCTRSFTSFPSWRSQSWHCRTLH